MDLRRIVRGRQTRNREFAAREPLICGAKSGDYRGWNRHTLPFSRVLWVAPGPNPDLAAFDGRLPADCNAMRHLEARAVKFGDLGGDVRHIVELGGSEKAGLGVHQRYSDDSEGHRQLIRFHLKRFLEKTPHAPIEILEEAAVENDANRVAVTPFDRELPAQNEISHARNRFSTGGYARRHKKPACAQDVKSSGTDEKALKSGYAAEKPQQAPPASSTPARKSGCAAPGWRLTLADVGAGPVQFEMPGRRSADPHSLITPASWEPSPAAVVVVVGINARSTKATAEMGEVMEAVEVGDVMEAAQTTDSMEATTDVADTAETAVEVADAVEAMEGVTAAMSAALTPARRRDGRRESCRDDCGCESSRKRRFSKHGFLSSAGRPPLVMLPLSADATLNVASRTREPTTIWAHCRHLAGALSVWCKQSSGE
jgi:hypothetical protein